MWIILIGTFYIRHNLCICLLYKDDIVVCFIYSFFLLLLLSYWSFAMWLCCYGFGYLSFNRKKKTIKWLELNFSDLLECTQLCIYFFNLFLLEDDDISLYDTCILFYYIFFNGLLMILLDFFHFLIWIKLMCDE